MPAYLSVLRKLYQVKTIFLPVQMLFCLLLTVVGTVAVLGFFEPINFAKALSNTSGFAFAVMVPVVASYGLAIDLQRTSVSRFLICACALSAILSFVGGLTFFLAKESRFGPSTGKDWLLGMEIVGALSFFMSTILWLILKKSIAVRRHDDPQR